MVKGARGIADETANENSIEGCHVPVRNLSSVICVVHDENILWFGAQNACFGIQNVKYRLEK